MTPTSTSSAAAPASRPSSSIVRPRTILYAVVIALVGGVMLYALATRATLDDQRASTTAIRCSCGCGRLDPQRLYDPDRQQGSCRPRQFALGSRLADRASSMSSAWRRAPMGASWSRSGPTRRMRCACWSPMMRPVEQSSAPIVFQLTDVGDRRDRAQATDHFVGP